MGERDRPHLLTRQSPTNETFQQVIGGGPSGARPGPCRSGGSVPDALIHSTAVHRHIAVGVRN